MAMSAYFDGSQTFGASGLLTLAGITARDKAWLEAEDRWREMLRFRYPVAPYVHMNQIFQHDDPFERVNGWTDEKQDELIWAALTLLSRLDKTEFKFIACSIDLDAHAKLVAEGISIPEPAVLCIANCVVAAVEYLAVRGAFAEFDRRGVTLYFDRGEKFKPTIVID